MEESRIRELIDACRPDSKDLADDEMRELREMIDKDARIREMYEQTQASDATIRKSLRQVNVPDGLADQLMDQLTPVLHQEGAFPGHEEDRLRVSPRRSWLITGAVATAAAVGGLFLVPSLLRPRLNAVELSQQARAWVNDLDDAWREDMSSAPENYPRSKYVAARPSGWQIYPTPLDEGSTAYRLNPSYNRGKPAVLFVTANPDFVTDVQETPPVEPLDNTAGRSSGLWQENDRLYVLVVPGGKRHYQSWFRSNQLAAINY